MASEAFLGIGANLGDRVHTLQQAVRRLHNTPGIQVLSASPVYASAPVGVTDQPDFLNAVLKIETQLTARALLHHMLAIEREFGRVRIKKWGPRTLDLDILTFGDAVIDEPGLQVPHPHLHKRGFVLAPLCDLFPQGMHPVLARSFGELAQAIDLSVGLHQVPGIDLLADQE